MEVFAHTTHGTPPLEQILRENLPYPQRVERIRGFLETRRASILEQHRSGSSGHYILIRLTALADTLLTGLFQWEAQQLARNTGQDLGARCALVALGGYGRGELNPYSDIDILFLYQEIDREAVEALASRVLYLLWDLRFTVGHSTRTVADCIRIAHEDRTVRTALMETRFLAGSEALFEAFRARFQKQVLPRRVEAYIDEKREEMARRHQQFGSSIYLLEPNIKESPGGLRDIHSLQWVALARYGTGDLAQLYRMGHLSHREYQDLSRAREFLWRSRNEMHFAARKAFDVLTFSEQERLARFFGFKDKPHRLGVERFMRRYYIHAARIHDICTRFIERARPVSLGHRLRQWLLSRRRGPFILTRDRIRVMEGSLKWLQDPETLLQLFYSAQMYGLEVDSRVLDLIHRNQDLIPRDWREYPGAYRVFRQILAWPRGAADTLRLLHRVHLLRRLIPVFARVHRLMQFDHYHKYTVDEHSFRAVEAAQQLLEEGHPWGRIYREIQRKDLLHLALLLHDVGKGSRKDHSQVGAEVARGVAQRMGLTQEETDLLVFLVRNHLLMAHVAFRRDLSDEKVILRFARQVGRPDVLKKLLILTCADIRAVGPDTWNEWKGRLLLDLYERTMEELTGGRVVPSLPERLAQIREDLRNRVCLLHHPDRIQQILEDLEPRYLLVTPPERILQHLDRLHRLSPEQPVLVQIQVTALYTEFIIFTYDRPGLFARIAGVLASMGYNILGAQVYTTRSGIVMDTFQAQDPFPEEPSAIRRREQTRKWIKAVLTGQQSLEELLARPRTRYPHPPMLSRDPTVVEVDNESSDEFTIIDIFANDRQGLLYQITRTLHELGLSIYSSRIATRADQIVDVFYVKDLNGRKIMDPEHIQSLRTRLREVIDAYLAQ